MKRGKQKMPAICWLKVTDYMHDWVRHELCGTLLVRNHPIVCLLHLKGVREIMRMKIYEDIELEAGEAENALSAQRYKMIRAGLDVSEQVTSQLYGISSEELQMYMPVECPPVCLTESGVLRPWTNDICFTHQQATQLQRLIRETFFKAVADFDARYAESLNGRYYPAVDMVEAFCSEMEINDMYVEAIRREWQRRQKRQ